MSNNKNSLKKLAEIFASMPGIGIKFSWRLAFHILTLKKEQVLKICETIINAYNNTKKCKICQNLTEGEICEICDDKKRNSSVICVVENSKDVVAFEKTNSFFGVYHVLHGLISPTKGVGPNQLTIKELFSRVKNDSVKEIILATSPTVEGEATAAYVAKILKPLKKSISKLANGISIGSEIQHADNITISKALENRTKI